MKVFGITGWKNSGKTGLMERLVREITNRGFTVSTIKHAHHNFDVDHQGKDSFRHREAGAVEVHLSSRNRWALMHELRGADEETLENALARMSPCDLVLVEGYKRDRHAKIEVARKVTRQTLIAMDDPTIVAMAADHSIDEVELPVFDLNDTAKIADFVLKTIGLADDTEVKQTKLRNDCFALPEGVSWVPVDDALVRLRQSMQPVVGVRECAVSDANGLVLATDIAAARSNPPAANSAIDGYGFAQSAMGQGMQTLPLLKGRSAAGAPFDGTVPHGSAIRILTGAMLPKGVDTVVMQEDVSIENNAVSFAGPVGLGMNARKAGEDVKKGTTALNKRCNLGAGELALLTGLGVEKVKVFERLRVGILSTGDEITPADGGKSGPEKTYDANRPMLLAMVEKWGHIGVDLGHVMDDRDALRDSLNDAIAKVDVILTSGGASAGDEDHLSKIMQEEGTLAAWRIALKPGRPLALGMWGGMPLFGLPGNPVAAFVCAAIFARPSLGVMAGGNWQNPQGFMLPAMFEKSKKAGRREYLRARVNDDGVEVFASEGSGRISGLAWANGLVELGDEKQTIKHGDVVRFIPYSSFGL